MAVPEKIKIRMVGVDDIPVIRQIAEIAFPYTYKDILPEGQIPYMMEMMYSEQSLKIQIVDEKNVFFVASTLDGDIGYASVRPDGKDVFHLEKLYVLPDCWHSRIGTTLFKHVLDYVHQENVSPCKVQLNVNRNNPAVGFYLKMGMRIAQSGDFDIGNGYFMNDFIMEIDA